MRLRLRIRQTICFRFPEYLAVTTAVPLKMPVLNRVKSMVPMAGRGPFVSENIWSPDLMPFKRPVSLSKLTERSPTTTATAEPVCVMTGAAGDESGWEVTDENMGELVMVGSGQTDVHSSRPSGSLIRNDSAPASVISAVCRQFSGKWRFNKPRPPGGMSGASACPSAQTVSKRPLVEPVNRRNCQLKLHWWALIKL